MRYLAFACLLLLAVVLASQTAHAGLDVSFSFRPLQFRPAITELGGGAELQFNQRAFTPTFRSVNVQTGVGVATPQLQQRSWTTGIGGIGAHRSARSARHSARVSTASSCVAARPHHGNRQGAALSRSSPAMRSCACARTRAACSRPRTFVTPRKAFKISSILYIKNVGAWQLFPRYRQLYIVLKSNNSITYDASLQSDYKEGVVYGHET